MLSPETLESYRRMTNSERLRLTLQMIRQEMPYLLRGSPEQVERRFERRVIRTGIRHVEIVWCHRLTFCTCVTTTGTGARSISRP